MSEERLNPDLDGTGGGFGKNKGMTVREMSEQFDRIASDGSVRAFSAILRISREQVEARGEFGVLRLIFFLCSGFAVVSAVAMALLSDPGRVIAMRCALGGLVAASLFAAGLLKNRAHAKAAFAQVAAIRDLSVDALVRVAREEGFKPKPLDFTQRHYLEELLKKTKRKEPELSAVLNLSE